MEDPINIKTVTLPNGSAITLGTDANGQIVYSGNKIVGYGGEANNFDRNLPRYAPAWLPFNQSYFGDSPSLSAAAYQGALAGYKGATSDQIQQTIDATRENIQNYSNQEARNAPGWTRYGGAVTSNAFDVIGAKPGIDTAVRRMAEIRGGYSTMPLGFSPTDQAQASTDQTTTEISGGPNPLYSIKSTKSFMPASSPSDYAFYIKNQNQYTISPEEQERLLKLAESQDRLEIAFNEYGEKNAAPSLYASSISDSDIQGRASTRKRVEKDIQDILSGHVELGRGDIQEVLSLTKDNAVKLSYNSTDTSRPMAPLLQGIATTEYIGTGAGPATLTKDQRTALANTTYDFTNRGSQSENTGFGLEGSPQFQGKLIGDFGVPSVTYGVVWGRDSSGVLRPLTEFQAQNQAMNQTTAKAQAQPQKDIFSTIDTQVFNVGASAEDVQGGFESIGVGGVKPLKSIEETSSKAGRALSSLGNTGLPPVDANLNFLSAIVSTPAMIIKSPETTAKLAAAGAGVAGYAGASLLTGNLSPTQTRARAAGVTLLASVAEPVEIAGTTVFLLSPKFLGQVAGTAAVGPLVEGAKNYVLERPAPQVELVESLNVATERTTKPSNIVSVEPNQAFSYQQRFEGPIPTTEPIIFNGELGAKAPLTNLPKYTAPLLLEAPKEISTETGFMIQDYTGPFSGNTQWTPANYLLGNTPFEATLNSFPNYRVQTITAQEINWPKGENLNEIPNGISEGPTAQVVSGKSKGLVIGTQSPSRFESLVSGVQNIFTEPGEELSTTKTLPTERFGKQILGTYDLNYVSVEEPSLGPNDFNVETTLKGSLNLFKQGGTVEVPINEVQRGRLTEAPIIEDVTVETGPRLLESAKPYGRAEPEGPYHLKIQPGTGESVNIPQGGMPFINEKVVHLNQPLEIQPSEVKNQFIKSEETGFILEDYKNPADSRAFKPIDYLTGNSPFEATLNSFKMENELVPKAEINWPSGKGGTSPNAQETTNLRSIPVFESVSDKSYSVSTDIFSTFLKNGEKYTQITASTGTSTDLLGKETTGNSINIDLTGKGLRSWEDIRDYLTRSQVEATPSGSMEVEFYRPKSGFNPFAPEPSQTISQLALNQQVQPKSIGGPKTFMLLEAGRPTEITPASGIIEVPSWFKIEPTKGLTTPPPSGTTISPVSITNNVGDGGTVQIQKTKATGGTTSSTDTGTSFTSFKTTEKLLTGGEEDFGYAQTNFPGSPSGPNGAQIAAERVNMALNPSINPPTLIDNQASAILPILIDRSGSNLAQTSASGTGQSNVFGNLQGPSQITDSLSLLKVSQAVGQSTASFQGTRQAQLQAQAQAIAQRQAQMELELQIQETAQLTSFGGPINVPAKPKAPHPPNPTFFFPSEEKRSKKKKKKRAPQLKLRVKVKPAKRSFYSDLLSVTQSQVLFGKGTSPSILKRPGVLKYTRNAAGLVPTVELLENKKVR